MKVGEVLLHLPWRDLIPTTPKEKKLGAVKHTGEAGRMPQEVKT